MDGNIDKINQKYFNSLYQQGIKEHKDYDDRYNSFRIAFRYPRKCMKFSKLRNFSRCISFCNFNSKQNFKMHQNITINIKLVEQIYNRGEYRFLKLILFLYISRMSIKARCGR